MAMTSGQLWDRITQLVESQGFVRSQNTFDFDQQPDGRLTKAYCLLTGRTGHIPFIGGGKIEEHAITIYLAQKAQRDAFGAARQLKVDMDILETAFTNDYPAYDYYVLDDPAVENEIQQPDDNSDFMIGRLSFSVDLDS